MKNLAGHPDADVHCIAELSLADVPHVLGDAALKNEVSTRVTGKLGPLTFERGWRYWMVRGPVPLDIAKALYDDPVCARDVRVAGHCGCPPPEEWCEYLDGNGKVIELDPTGEREAEVDAWFARHPQHANMRGDTRFVRELPSDAKAFVMSYHVDSQEGLNLLATAMRGAL